MKLRVKGKVIEVATSEALWKGELAEKIQRARGEELPYGDRVFALRELDTGYATFLVPEDRPGKETHYAVIGREEARDHGGYFEALLQALDQWVVWANGLSWDIGVDDEWSYVDVLSAPSLEALAEVVADLARLPKEKVLEALRRREDDPEVSGSLFVWERWLEYRERFLGALPSPKRLEEPHALVEFSGERGLLYLMREADWEAVKRARPGAAYELEAYALTAYSPYAVEDPYLLEKALREGEGSVLGDVGRIALDQVKLSVYHGGRGAVLVDWSEDGEHLFLRFPEREGGLPEEAEGWERGLERGKAKESYARLYGLWRAGFRGFLPSTDLASGEPPEEVFGAVLDEDGAQVLARLVLGEGGLGLEEVPLERLAKAAKEVALEELAEV